MPLVTKPLADASMQPLSKLVDAVPGAVAGQLVAVPAGEPHQTLFEPHVCELADDAMAARTTADAAASAAVWAASRRKYPQPRSTARLNRPIIRKIETVAIRIACPLRL